MYDPFDQTPIADLPDHPASLRSFIVAAAVAGFALVAWLIVRALS